MPDLLLIDAGNTQVKWTISTDGELSASRAFRLSQDNSWLIDQELIRAARSVDQAFIASVADDKHEQRLVEGLQSLLSTPLRVVKVQPKAFGIAICYKNAGRLGVDRWAAMIAARQLVNGALCVFDCGTATTFDMLDPCGQHLGGLIVPGPRLMASSLREGTARIYGDDENSKQGLLACDTVSAITAGGLQATLGFIERMQREASEMTGVEPTFLLCGGHAKDLLPWLPDNIRHEPDLVLKGLNILAVNRL